MIRGGVSGLKTMIAAVLAISDGHGGLQRRLGPIILHDTALLTTRLTRLPGIRWLCTHFLTYVLPSSLSSPALKRLLKIIVFWWRHEIKKD